MLREKEGTLRWKNKVKKGKRIFFCMHNDKEQKEEKITKKPALKYLYRSLKDLKEGKLFLSL